MPQTYWFTRSGEPPNDGIPPRFAFFGQAGNDNQLPPYTAEPRPVFIMTPPLSVNNASLPAGAAPAATTAVRAPGPRAPVTRPPAPGPRTPAPRAPGARTPAAVAKKFDIPGIKRDGASFIQKGKAYVFPKKHATVNFFPDGTRPFEKPPGFRPKYATLVIPTSMMVVDLMHQLGVPSDDNDRYGVTECFEADGDGWTKGKTYILSEDQSKKTLEQVGWNESRTIKQPIWLAVHNKKLHGPT